MDETRTIALTQGQVTVIDAADFERVSAFKWCAFRRGDNKPFYAARTVKNQSTGRYSRVVYLHHFISGITGRMVDHKNGDTLDNRRENLRPATAQQNSWNKRRTKKRAAIRSRFRGVHWQANRGKWAAQICVNQRSRHLGVFIDETKAAEAYNIAAVDLFGEFAALNDLNTPAQLTNAGMGLPEMALG